MDLIERLIKGKIALNNEESTQADITALSKVIDDLYPGISVRYSSTYYYPTLESFCKEHKTNQVCFYNVEAKTWDGYSKFEHAIIRSIFDEDPFYRADEILADCNIQDINEEDLMEIFN